MRALARSDPQSPGREGLAEPAPLRPRPHSDPALLLGCGAGERRGGGASSPALRCGGGRGRPSPSATRVPAADIPAAPARPARPQASAPRPGGPSRPGRRGSRRSWEEAPCTRVAQPFVPASRLQPQSLPIKVTGSPSCLEVPRGSDNSEHKSGLHCGNPNPLPPPGAPSIGTRRPAPRAL